MEELTPLERALLSAAQARDTRLKGSKSGVREQKQRGVVHTPPELARFVVRRVDALLKETGAAHFESGIASPSVSLLDPACGPGAFLGAALSTCEGRASAPRQVLAMDSSPLAVKSALALLRPACDERGWPFQVATGNSLENLTPFEAPAPFVVVIGNPPWASVSQNRTGLAEELLEDFRRGADGKRLSEKKLGVLSDDYVRFTRWAAEVIRGAQAGGALGFVLNGSFLDGPVHRGMRAALLRWFDQIEIWDLGGSSLTARKTGQMARADENVFGVRTSVAALIGIRWPESERTLSNVTYGRVFGTKAEKLSALLHKAPFPTDSVAEFTPSKPAYAFVPRRIPAEYPRFVSLSDAMPFHREGVQTNRDALVTCSDRATLVTRLRAFADGSLGSPLSRYYQSKSHFDPNLAREVVREKDRDGNLAASLVQLDYRPFETRWCFPFAPLCHRARPDLVRAVAHGALGLITVRKDRGDRDYRHFGVSSRMVDNCWLSSRSSCRTRVFPEMNPAGQENLEPGLKERLSALAGRHVSARDFIYYVLALLAASRFTDRFRDGLLSDYPRVPLPLRRDGFQGLSSLGEQVAIAFLDPASGEPDAERVDVGHRVIRSRTLSEAIAPLNAEVARVGLA